MWLQGAIECPNSYKRGPPAGPGRAPYYRVALRYLIPVLRGEGGLSSSIELFCAPFGLILGALGYLGLF